jgi:hypothetical protein
LPCECLKKYLDIVLEYGCDACIIYKVVQYFNFTLTSNSYKSFGHGIYCPMVDKRKLTVTNLYPDLSPKEQDEVAKRLRQYLAVIKRIHDRLEREGKLE